MTGRARVPPDTARPVESRQLPEQAQELEASPSDSSVRVVVFSAPSRS